MTLPHSDFQQEKAESPGCLGVYGQVRVLWYIGYNRLICESPAHPKELVFIPAARKSLLEMPRAVIHEIGRALNEVQHNETPANAKPLKGFGGASVMEIRENYDTDTYRAVYTVQFGDTVYVLHCFQKKSKSGNATTQQDMDLIKSRLQVARKDYEERR